MLRTNNGGEFCSIEYDKFCKKNGNKTPKITPYTPQQNRVIEWMNRTLMERSKSMFSGVGLKKKFFEEVIVTTC